MQYFWEALNNFTNGQWKGQSNAWLPAPVLGQRQDGSCGRSPTVSPWTRISFCSTQRTGAASCALSRAAAACLRASTSTLTSWGERGCPLPPPPYPRVQPLPCVAATLPDLWSLRARSYETTDALPESSTCSSTLFLPHYARWVS